MGEHLEHLAEVRVTIPAAEIFDGRDLQIEFRTLLEKVFGIQKVCTVLENSPNQRDACNLKGTGVVSVARLAMDPLFRGSQKVEFHGDICQLNTFSPDTTWWH